ncbi:cytokinesis regulator (Byr4), putative [Talaromyces stipitatus ATCC 10500]|uniref:Cytokinesis regulator (Byr4), putative n=1 Tax=Talaromyces stipitatus (strain ATCC 10500 / CBS 375.48 / QM 6759 / NRRL 1006) TaxID=441959 RepID=B8MIH8_TALSN|nr:cytokinesis regulator (Byr4), putative [Talaromyces stipitatus ATCC 10500]EED15070.1 cytokinesis regulator (Byr4), putative [Talaromyces stipitatus ATCC 10500]
MQADTFHILQGESPPIESWDDDGDLQCFDDAQFHAISTTTSVTGSMLRSGHRDSISSRLSIRSDVESNAGDEDWQLLLRDNDETAIEEAIASARSAGIPIPDNVPKSALLSGSIKKLQSKQNKKSSIDDWSEDLEFPAADAELALKPNEQESFPESIQQIHTPLNASPAKSRDSVDNAPFRGVEATTPPSITAKETIQGLGFQDVKQESQDVPTINTSTASQLHLPHTPSIGSHSPAVGVARDKDDEFEKDFEFPTKEMTLKLCLPSSIPNNIPSINDDIWDIGWADGDGNGRFGGVKRDMRSTQSSSVSAFSPSASSCLTAETEDDGLDGLILPDGPFSFEENLKKRKVIRPDTEEPSPKSKPTFSNNNNKGRTETDGFFDDLDIDDGSVFASMQSNVHRNVKRKLDPHPMTPGRSEKTITFTSKTPSVSTRIPRLSGHSRSHTSLEPVSESGNAVTHFRKPQSRLTAHSNRSSVGSIHTSPPVTPSGGRRSLGGRISREGMTSDLSSSHAQLLKSKRSAPSARGREESTSGAPFQRPSSRQESTSMIPTSSRPKTPVDRSTTDSSLGNNRSQAPFLPAGASQSQSHHVSVKYSRQFRRSDSETSTDSTIGPKSASRLSYPLRSDNSNRLHAHSASEGSNIIVKRPVTRPARRRNYGDGTELESFDDLPTSTLAESRFVKTPVGRGVPRSVRNGLAQSPTATRTETPVPSMMSNAPSRPSSTSFTPRFARDTNASRIAREQRIASLSLPSRNRDSAPLAPLSTNWKGHQTPRQSDPMLTVRSKKGKASRPGGSRPQLIRPMGSGVSEAKNVKGMQYNPSTYRWEGNENEVAEFDAINIPKSPKVAPALITSVGTIKGGQVVGGMVFDPQRMCWLKIASTQPGADKVAVIHDELEDVFAGLEDLQDKPELKHRRNISEASVPTEAFDDQSGDSSEEWPITEEFDVGPEFVKRQRAEEDRWKRKLTKWVTPERQRIGDGWRWAIRDLVPGGN